MISTERTPSIRPSWSTTAAYWASPWSRSARASRMMSSRSSSGPSGESGLAGHGLGAEVALGEPAERAALAVDQQRVGDFDVGLGQLRPHLGGRLADVGERRLPEVDVGDPHQRQPLQRPVGADEVLDELGRPAPSAPRPGSRTARPCRPRA